MKLRFVLSIKVQTNARSHVAFSPDGKRLAGASDDKTVKVWDAQTGRELVTCTGHTDRVTNLAFSPDGKRLISASYDKTVKVWDSQTGQEVLTFKGHSNRVSGLSFNLDGKRLASTSGREVKVWDAQTGQELLSLQNGGGSVAFSPDGNRLASSCRESSSSIGPGGVGEVKVWDAQTGQELLTLKGHSANISSVVFSPDGKRLASLSGNEVKVWDAQTGQELLTLKGRLTSVAFSPNSHWLAGGSSDGAVKIYGEAVSATGPTRRTDAKFRRRERPTPSAANLFSDIDAHRQNCSFSQVLNVF
jgi:eukaryotic-like serine/threonine-protein kinase